MATLYQHPRAPVVFTRARPAGCIGRCPVCDPRCDYPQTAPLLKACKAAQEVGWTPLILAYLFDGDESGARAYAARLSEDERGRYLAKVDRLAALWAKGTARAITVYE